MRALAWAAVAAGLTVLGAGGCNRQSADGPAATNGVAVIDLDAIAHRLGSDKQIVESIAQKQTALSQQLVELAKSYNQQIADRKKTLEEAKPEESQVTLAAWQQQANDSLNKVKQQAAADLQKHRAQLVQQFRDQIKPAARRVAESRGLSVIVTKNDSVLYDFSASADITDAVVAELLASQAPAAK
jgi:Skp family chaperone for outer membrane proteins